MTIETVSDIERRLTVLLYAVFTKDELFQLRQVRGAVKIMTDRDVPLFVFLAIGLSSLLKANSVDEIANAVIKGIGIHRESKGDNNGKE